MVAKKVDKTCPINACDLNKDCTYDCTEIPQESNDNIEESFLTIKEINDLDAFRAGVLIAIESEAQILIDRIGENYPDLDIDDLIPMIDDAIEDWTKNSMCEPEEEDEVAEDPDI